MNKIVHYLPNHNAYELTPIANNIIRIRYNASGIFPETLTERYELLNFTCEEVATEQTKTDEGIEICAGEIIVSIKNDTSFSISSAGKTVIENIEPFSPQEQNGCGAKIKIFDEERFYGCGYRPNDGIELRGQVVKNWCTPVANNGPSTWILSSGGWGLLWNNTSETYFDVGHRQPDKLITWSSLGEMDFFIVLGGFKQLIKGYTSLTGTSSLMPRFGYGITVVNNEAEDQNSLFAKAERIREEKIPCDTFSVSCEWMSKYYDVSVNQKFDTSKYFVEDWMDSEDQTFIGALKNKGIKTTLWTPCRYDLTHEQERRYYAKHPEKKVAPLYERSERKTENYALSIEQKERNFYDDKMFRTMRTDPYTVVDQAWAEHFKKYFDIGVIGIAEDGSYVETAKLDYCYGNGYTYREMHNLNQYLNAYQYYTIYREHTGKRIFVRTPSTFMGNQRYCGTWCGDTTSDVSLIGLVQYSFQGMSNVSADLISRNPQEIHAGMFMPWVLNFCWGYMMWPWMLKSDLKEIYIDYAKLRYSLIPYIYTEAYKAHTTGIPMCTAMIINYPDDERFYNIHNQYMFGESFLVGVNTDTIHLPNDGKWIDYWTGKEYDGNTTITNAYPEDKGGYLFVKKGAIIPQWENVMFDGEKPIDNMTISIYPDKNSTQTYTLYEDDGITFAYENGEYSLTDIQYSATDFAVQVTVGKPVGKYEGMPENRSYHIEVYTDKPAKLPNGMVFNDEKKAVCFTIENNGTVTIPLS